MTDQRPTIAAEERVSWNQLLAFGMGGVIPIALFNAAPQLVSVLGNISLGLSALLLGTIMVLPRVWDAISDPLMGHISDNTRTRWGRRRPYILIGGLAVAISFVAMWWVPRGEWLREYFGQSAYNWFQLGYILLAMLAFFTATTVFEIPHGALGMEMSGDYHERTRLFSAKSFFGNLAAMGTPWLFFLAGREMFRGPGGDMIDGMRSLSMVIASILVPLSVWWFISLREPGFAVAKQQPKSGLWHDLRTTLSNATFLKLVAIVFVLAMGFDFVSIFSYYIAIFYLYGGHEDTAGTLLGITGTVWGVTGVLAVFPLNWLGKRLGKNRTLLIAILLMSAAQLSKIFCYRQGILFQFDLPDWVLTMWQSLEQVFPDWLLPAAHRTITVPAPYLILIPTIMLSAGMLMFFTLGSSMVGDICDEDELKTGTRSEGSYYAVFWWFIKVGRSLAIFGMGALLAFTGFDEQQNVAVSALQKEIAAIESEAKAWTDKDTAAEARLAAIGEQSKRLTASAGKLRDHFVERARQHPDQAAHLQRLIDQTDAIRREAESLRARRRDLVGRPSDILRETQLLRQQMAVLKNQPPKTLFRLRLVEIGLPLVMCCVSILLTLGYPLTEARAYEIKAALKERRAARQLKRDLKPDI